jgi:hypothetical protein
MSLIDRSIADAPVGYISNGRQTIPLPMPDGIAKDLTLHIEGTAGGTVTALAEDAEIGIIQSMRAIFPMKDGTTLTFDADPRDYKQYGLFHSGTLAPATGLIATGAAGATSGICKIHFAPPDVVTENDEWYGLPTDELAGPGQLDIVYNPAATALGTGGTIATGAVKVHISAGMEIGGADERPLGCLYMTRNRVIQVAATRSPTATLQPGNGEFAWGLFVKQMQTAANSSVPNDKKVDGLVTRYILEHNRYGQLINNTFSVLRTESQLMFKVAKADMPKGCFLFPFGNRGKINKLPIMLGGAQLSAVLDSAETETADITAVTPVNDYINMNIIGVKLMAAGRARLAKYLR